MSTRDTRTYFPVSFQTKEVSFAQGPGVLSPLLHLSPHLPQQGHPRLCGHHHSPRLGQQASAMNCRIPDTRSLGPVGQGTHNHTDKSNMTTEYSVTSEEMESQRMVRGVDQASRWGVGAPASETLQGQNHLAAEPKPSPKSNRDTRQEKWAQWAQDKSRGQSRPHVPSALHTLLWSPREEPWAPLEGQRKDGG